MTAIPTATLIGFASRKLRRCGDAKYRCEKALAADPNHALTRSYYGTWQAGQLRGKDDCAKCTPASLTTAFHKPT